MAGGHRFDGQVFKSPSYPFARMPNLLQYGLLFYSAIGAESAVVGCISFTSNTTSVRAANKKTQSKGQLDSRSIAKASMRHRPNFPPRHTCAQTSSSGFRGTMSIRHHCSAPAGAVRVVRRRWLERMASSNTLISYYVAMLAMYQGRTHHKSVRMPMHIT